MNQPRNLDLASIVVTGEADPSFQVPQYSVLRPHETVPEMKEKKKEKELRFQTRFHKDSDEYDVQN